jgi:uncharacterized protein (TIGR04255 family)
MPVLLVTRTPYPGWETIRNELREVIFADPLRPVYTGCMLRYTDRFVHPPGMDRAGLNSGVWERIVEKKGDDYQVSTGIPETTAVIRYIAGTRESVFIFTVRIDGSPGLSGEDVLTWFDAAHDEIHLLFDISVPEELVRTLG